ncbi:MAG: protein kinase domain-containing protein, partial [Planctomycetota bacterium]
MSDHTHREDPESFQADATDRFLDLAFGQKLLSRAREQKPISVVTAVERRTGSSIRLNLPEAEENDRVILRSCSDDDLASLGSARYQVLGEIAKGGVGVVYKSRDVDLCRDVAMKVVHERFKNRPEMLHRFVEEAQIGGQLQHPGIVPVYEIGLLADDRPYFAMKLVKGVTLGLLLAKRKGPDEERQRFLTIFKQVCQTVAYSHARHVVHRDLKPSNVMVGTFGEVQVVDWGFAKVLPNGGAADDRRTQQPQRSPRQPPLSVVETMRTQDGSSHSTAGSVLGTPAYMPPEQARGHVEELDERSDVFSLGAVLCEILTGEPPYVVAEAEGQEAGDLLAMAAAAELPPALQRLDTCGADDELVRLAGRCLSASRAARPRDASVVAEEISGYLHAVEERAQTAQLAAAEARGRVAEERRARKVVLGLASAVIAIILLGTGGYLWVKADQDQRLQQASNKVQAALQEARRLQGQAEAAQGDARAIWKESLAAARRAEDVAATEGVEQELRQQVVDLLGTLNRQATQATKDWRMLRRLEEVPVPPANRIAFSGWTREESSRLDREYTVAFERYGVDVDRVPVAEAADRLSGAISQQLAAALDHWAVVRFGRGKERDGASWRPLIDLARRLDSGDTLRNSLRGFMAASPRKPSDGKRESMRLQELVASTDPSQLSGTGALFLGDLLVAVGEVKSAIEIYGAAQRVHPDDFMLNFRLGRVLEQLDPPRFEEAAEYYAIALALRPRITYVRHQLMGALVRDGRHEAGIATARAFVQGWPEDWASHFSLGYALAGQGDQDAAIRAYRRAIELEPDLPQAHMNLGVALWKKGELSKAIEHYRRAIEL